MGPPWVPVSVEVCPCRCSSGHFVGSWVNCWVGCSRWRGLCQCYSHNRRPNHRRIEARALRRSRHTKAGWTFVPTARWLLGSLDSTPTPRTCRPRILTSGTTSDGEHQSAPQPHRASIRLSWSIKLGCHRASIRLSLKSNFPPKCINQHPTRTMSALSALRRACSHGECGMQKR